MSTYTLVDAKILGSFVVCAMTEYTEKPSQFYLGFSMAEIPLSYVIQPNLLDLILDMCTKISKEKGPGCKLQPYYYYYLNNESNKTTRLLCRESGSNLRYIER